jgi:membrane protease YdiL (CAAX protease family)
MTDSAASAPLTPPPNTPRSAAAEAAVVFGATVGVSVVGGLLFGSQARASTAFTNRHLLGVGAFELLLTALLVPWLRRRGWTPGGVAGAPSPADIARGVGVSLLAFGCYWAVWVLFATLSPEVASALAAERRFTGVPAGALAIVLVSVVNPVFEEFLWLGYGVARLADRIGLRTAALLSLGLRLAVHVYQGPWAVLGVLPLGLAFTWYYGRTRRLWPVVVAHVLFDALGLAQRLAAGQ